MNRATRIVEDMLIEHGFRPLREEGTIWQPITFVQADGNLVGPFTWVIKARRTKAKAKRTSIKTHKLFFPDWHQTTPGDLLATIERAQIEDSQRTWPNDPTKHVVAILDPTKCPHPKDDIRYNVARDDSVPSGQLLCKMCVTCMTELGAWALPTTKTKRKKGATH